MNNKGRGLLIVISGPSGAGKGTICKSFLERNPEVAISVSATTRSPRKGEVEGVNYYFMSKEEFKGKIEDNDFLEYAEVYEYCPWPSGPRTLDIYGTVINGSIIVKIWYIVL